MKNIFIVTIFFLFISNIGKAQTTLAYTYDAAGNMIQRQIQIIPPIPNQRPSNPFESTEQKKDSISDIQFKIYPNPAQTFVTIEGKLPENCSEAKVQLLNSTGQILKINTYNSETKTMDVSDLKNGIYLLEIICNKKQKSTYKIIVTN